ncbi:GNAT family N-acetyltransferase [Rhizobium sp. S-51]|uniref:GNAT family N-acetyltransferase n=1 Tax=Rhizobium terricola TaxID=2728849 RepID=A0A7Y0FV27_9HYPH|nr:GNAT family N-acetyltransferase [Rhizobium terricola]NML74008.1 GNAT family N-acetyltransferase [Rhizobium terricola]
MHVDALSSLVELDALKQNWNEVFAADPDGHYFLSWHWLRRWLEKAGPWRVLAARSGDASEGYVAFLPIQLRTEFDETRGLFNTIGLAGAHFSAYCGMLALPAHADEAVDAFSTHLKGFAWRHLALDDIVMPRERLQRLFSAFPAETFRHAKIKRAEHITDAGEDIDHDTYVYVPLPGDYEALLNERLGSRTRYHARRAMRELQMPERELFISLPTTETLARDIDILCSLWWGQWGPQRPAYGRFIIENTRHMLPACFADGSLHMPILWHRGKAIAAFVLFLDPSHRTVVAFLSGRDMTADRSVSPGLILHCHSLRWAIENGYEIYDLGTGDYSYKDAFGAEHRQVERFRISTHSGQNLGGRLDPRTLDAAFSKAAVFDRAGRMDAAALCCRQILATDPAYQPALELGQRLEQSLRQRVDGLVAAALSHLRSGALAAAEADLRDALDFDPHCLPALLSLAALLMQKNAPDDAAALLGRALAVAPSSAAVHLQHGNVLIMQSRLDEALQSYDKAIALDGTNAVAFSNRGTLLRKLRRLDEAEESYRQALALDPANEQAARNLGRLQSEAGGALDGA